ncbi:hypothetical protein HY345_00815 [Candidatus Microgenomates bacterium]|nr:hypothetical protein [Candidatus Microgenomates bacterium]
MQYSVWVIPPEPLYGNLKKIIDSLATKFHGPTFEPHMTLFSVADLNLSQVKETLSLLTKPENELALSLGPVSFSTTYYQSVFVRVNSTAQLMQLNLNAKKYFNLNNDVYMPHMSLIYGAHDLKTRENIASQIKLTEEKFVGKDLTIIEFRENTTKWEHLATIPLGK